MSQELLLVSLNISMFGNTQTDKNLTSDTARAHAIDESRLKVVKSKIAERDLKPVRSARNALVKVHKFLTTPYGIDSIRILSADLANRYESEIAAATEVFNAAADELQGQWSRIVAQARVDLNGSFSESDYPVTIRDAFSVSRSVQPLPSDSHLSSAMQALYGEKLREEVERRKEEATREAYRRMIEPVAAMAEKLGNPDAIFRDSLVENVRNMAAIAGDLNAAGDPQLSALVEQVQSILDRDPDELRNLPELRRETAEQAAAIVAQFGRTGNRVIS